MTHDSLRMMLVDKNEVVPTHKSPLDALYQKDILLKKTFSKVNF